MADIAAAFSWPLRDLEALTLAELVTWYELAVPHLRLRYGLKEQTEQ